MDRTNLPLPRRRPPPPPSQQQPHARRRQPPPRPPKPKNLQENILCELPGDNFPIEIYPPELAASSPVIDHERQFDNHLQYVAYPGPENQPDNHIQQPRTEIHIDPSDPLEQPLPPLNYLTQIARELHIPLACRSCHATSLSVRELVFCRGCRHSFHQHCWRDYEDHVRTAWRPQPCSGYTSLERHVWVSHLHASQNDELGLLEELVSDRYHRWIGTPDTTDGDVELEKQELMLYPTLARLFTEFNPSKTERRPRKQYPRLVAFFGDTGMGKSTIIKNLIRHLTSSKEFDVPVVGSCAEVQNSTSAGVHIYTDPMTFRDDRPIVYVDCEGLRGDSSPIANQVDTRIRRAKLRKPMPQRMSASGSRNRPIQPDLAQEETLKRGLVNKPHPVSTMPLPWAEKASKPWRSTVSEKIYPRFLYVFSDVVCYVSGNSRTAEDDMAQLVDWAHDAHDFTTNQGVKPGLLYIINQDNHSDIKKWQNIDYATKIILEKLRKSKRFAREQNLWESRGRKVATADQLLRCYYSSVKVVFIPQFLPFNPSCEADDLWRQYQSLHQEIIGLSYSSSEHRREARVQFSVENLSRHCIGVLQQLADNYTSSVDLRKLAEPAQSYPCGFHGHVLNILSRFQDMAPRDYRISDQDIGPEEALIRKVFKYVAICIAREIKRTTFDLSSELGQIEYYTQKWRLVLEDFSRTRSRCEKISHGQQCVNYRISHVKGHQFNLNGRESVLEGKFVSRFLEALDSLQEELATKLPHYLKASASNKDLQRDLWYCAVTCGVGGIFSNRTCLACLSRTPVHILPCHHSLCDPCAETLNSYDPYKGPKMVIHQCPLGCKWHDHKWEVRRKAPEAGVRVLSLDGGGVRGVAQIAILQEIVSRVGHDIPIQELFDVIVGSGTGGIISIGLFKKQWSIFEAQHKFERLMKAAFSKRSMLKLLWPLPGGSASAQIMLNYLYKSEDLERALEDNFGSDERFFSRAINDRQAPNKIAVIATGEEKDEQVLLTNYNREWLLDDEESNNLRREERPKDELKIWEVARCTSAAPTYFEHYYHAPTNRIYRDGTMETSNPIQTADQERQLIWPNPSENSLDILLSLGTGYSSTYDGEVNQPSKAPKSLKPLEQIGLVAKIATLRLTQQNTSNCHSKWLEFKEFLSTTISPTQKPKYHRLNIPLGRGQSLPQLDDLSKLTSLQNEATSILTQTSHSLSPPLQTHLSQKLEKISHQLLASLFYLRILDAYDINSYKYHVLGTLYCRLSPNLKIQMGSLINNGRPNFRIEEEGNPEGEEVIFGRDGWNYSDFSIGVAFDASCFEMKGVRMTVMFEGWKKAVEISGFPRKIKRRERTMR